METYPVLKKQPEETGFIKLVNALRALRVSEANPLALLAELRSDPDAIHILREEGVIS